MSVLAAGAVAAVAASSMPARTSVPGAALWPLPAFVIVAMLGGALPLPSNLPRLPSRASAGPSSGHRIERGAADLRGFLPDSLAS